MSRFLERTGSAEVLLGDDSLANGTYHLFVEQASDDGLPGQTGRSRAWGTIRFREGQTPHRAMRVPAVRVRLDWETEVTVNVYLCVPGASFVAFTSDDVPALVQVLERR